MRSQAKSGRKRRGMRSKLLKRDGVWIMRGGRRTFALCHWCPRIVAGPDLTIDHVIPLWDGGSWELDNLVLACQPCNNERNPHYRRPVPPPNFNPAFDYRGRP